MHEGETEAARLVAEYRKLGGTRRVKIDDNHVTTRTWEGEPAAASDFWNTHIATLDQNRRREVETLLPDINTL
ncbi:hypothetical protein [Rhizobium halophytocola]|uniref:Uncharacterized protein n=1 Tax=Rhizobium halophytocola TaxID=735519 RepID=A0ABS4E5N2_9HYPH|nr:hypothetical protein [Rhizobium halophytocola]MBP1853237.1 hypothetical protein [Rhizobium halophytocola]